MSNTLRGREFLFPYDHELECTLCNMNRVLGMMIQTRTSQLQLMLMVSCYPMLRVNTKRGDKIPFHGPQAYYRGYDNIADSDGPLVLPPLPIGHTFVVTSSLMQMLTARGLFSGLPSEDPHAHIAKVRAVCKSCVGRPDLDLDVIGLRVFPRERLLYGSLTSHATQYSLGTN